MSHASYSDISRSPPGTATNHQKNAQTVHERLDVKYHENLVNVMSSRYALKARSLVLVFLMITMAQVGYTSNGFQSEIDTSLDLIDDVSEVPSNNDVASLFVGGGHSCVITEGDLMKCWGNNTAGQLGIGNSESMGDEVDEMGDQLPYLNLGTDLIPESAALGMAHTCILFTNNSVKCFGDINALGLGYTDSNGAGDGYLETGDYLPFWPSPTGRNVSQIAAGWYHTCVVLDDGSMTCWGENSNGQLGMGNTTDLGQESDQVGDSVSYVPLPSGVTVSDMALGADHTCVLYDTGDVACWGGNDYGQLGIGSTEDILDESAETLTNISFPSGRYAIDITAGEGFTCALLDNNQAICWGLNDVGQLGLGHSNNYGDSSSEPISSLSTIDLHISAIIRTIDAGYDHVCVALNNNVVKCWGGNLFGHLGIGVSGPSAHRGDDVNEMGANLPAIALGSSPNPFAVEVGENFACMLKQAGNMPVKCWGTSVNGRLGYENTEALGDSSSDNLANVVELGLDSEYESVDCGGADPFLHETNILPAEELDNSGNGRKIDMAFRSDGCPAILYTDDNADNLRFAMYDNGIWVYEYPYSSAAGSSVGDLSILFDENDIPHLAWSDIGYDTTNNDTHYATKANGKWNHVQLSTLPANTYNTEIIQFDDGDLEIIAAPFTTYLLQTNRCVQSEDCLDSSNWTASSASNDFRSRAGFDSSINPSGDAWLSYTVSNSTNSFNVQTNNSYNGWTSYVQVAQNSTGTAFATSDIEVAVDGTVHAVYLHEDYATDGIMYTSCSGGWSDCNSASDWSFIPVPHVTNDTFSLAVDYDLVPHIFFNASSSLKFIKLVDGTWSSPVEVLNLGVSEIEANFHESGKLWLAARIQSPSNTLWVVEGASFGGNGMSIDIDGDGWSGIEEYRCDSDMMDSDSVPTDADFDGICDAEDEIHDLFTYGESRTISVGEDFACGLTAQPDDGSNSNTLYCWGSDSHSQLGNFVVSGTSTATSTAWAVPVLDLPPSWHAVDVDVGARHACAIGVDGDVYCWGDNAHGQLGINSTVATSLPVEVQLPANTRAMSISAGSQHTCVVTTAGELYCWGDSSNQQLGEYFLANSSGYVEETFSSSNWLDTTALGDVYIGKYFGSTSHDYDWAYSANNGGTLKWDLRSSYTYYNQFSFPINALSDGYITFDVKSDTGTNDGICLHIDSSCTGWYHPPNSWNTRNHSFTAGTHEIQFVGRNQHGSSGFNDMWIDNVQIHAGYSLEEGGIVRTPSRVSLGSMIVSEVTTGDDHTCVVSSTGAAYCWGDNGGSTTMTLGNSSFTGTNSSSPLLVDLAGTGSQYSGPQPPRFGLLSAGAGATCGTLLTNASTICWGKSSAGTSILGGGSGPSIHGTFVSLNDTTSSLSVGHHHACAVVDEKIQCWGEENGGELGDGGSSSSSSSTPVEVDITGLGTPIDVSVSEIGNTSCALFKKDLAYSFRCWGSDEVGAIGDDASYNNETSPSSNVTTLTHGFVEPTAPSSSLDVANYDIAEVSGGNAFYCARSYQGLVKCWGNNGYGRLGIGNTNGVGDNLNEMGDNQAFTDLGTNLFATDITTGDNFACAVLNNTQVKCWGYGSNGQLGIGTTTYAYGDAANEMGDNLPYVRSPSSSTPLSGIVKVDAGHRAACALSSDGQVYCWGYNDNYLVKATTSSSSTITTPWTQTQLSRPAIDISVGYNHACAILDNHQVQCWGRNSEGQLGAGNTTNPSQSIAQKERPYVDLGSDVGASDIMAGGHYTCAILTTEGTVCWGHGSQYRHGRNSSSNFITMGEGLGNGTGSPYDTIAKSHRSSLSPNSPHTCIVDESSEVQCWGATHVVPGSGGAAPQTVDVGGLVRSVAVTDASACALRIDGNLICWGSASSGQLGHGSANAHNYANTDGSIVIEQTDVRLLSPDTDFDGTINLWDEDDDDDGVLDINDDFSLDECASLDTDNDGMPNSIVSSCSTTLIEDLDDDNDGWSDVNETNCDTNTINSISTPIDTDSDGICNHLDSDDDGDGWSDAQENECEANTFSSFRAFTGTSSHFYPSLSYSGELYFGGIGSQELRYLGVTSSNSYTGMWRWDSASTNSQPITSSARNLATGSVYDLTLEHQDGITYWAGRQYQGQYADTSTEGPRNEATYQNLLTYSSAYSYQSVISVDASNRMYIADGDDRFYFQTSSQANTSTFSYVNLPNTNSYDKHHIEAQDNGTVHHLWWYNNNLRYTQSHDNGASRSYDSIETIGTWSDSSTKSFDLEVDSNGVAHIAFYRNSGSSYAVTYMNNSGGSFSSIQFEDLSPDSYGELDLDLDASDRVHLAWNDGTNGTVYHTLIDGSSTVTQQVTSHSTNPTFMSQAIDLRTNKSFIMVNAGQSSTISYPGSFVSESLDSTLVPGDIDSDGICDNLETAPLIYSNPVFEAGMTSSITPTFPGLQPTLIINTTPLPAGLTLNPSTGVISGTPSNTNIAFSVTLNSTSAQENWTGTIEIKITPMAPVLVSNDGFDGCSNNYWQNQDIVYASDGSMYFVGNWNTNYCNAYPTNIPGMENSTYFNSATLVLSKRSANGTMLWVHGIQSSAALRAADLALDANDKPILLFQTNGNYATEFDRSNNWNIPAYAASTLAMIWVQFDSDGQIIWRDFTVQGPGTNQVYVEAHSSSETSLVVSPDGNITFSGQMKSTSSSYPASFSIGSGNNQMTVSRSYCSGNYQPFIVRLNSTGTPLWMRTGEVNPVGTSTVACSDHYALDLAVKSDGGVILATRIDGQSVGFGNLFTTNPQRDSPAIFSFDSTGQPEWLQLVHSSLTPINGVSIAVFDDDSVHVTATPNYDTSNHGNIVLFYDTGLTTSDPRYNSGWNTTKYSYDVWSWSSTQDSRAWLLTARLDGSNGTPIWVDMNTEKIDSYDGYGSRCTNNLPSPVSYVSNNVAYTYVTDYCSSNSNNHLSAYYRSSTIDNEEIHSVSSTTSCADYDFGIVDFGPDSNDNAFILQRSDCTFYWGRFDSSSGFTSQSVSSSSYPVLYNILGETGHQIQDNVPQVGVYTDKRPGSMVNHYSAFATWSLIGINGSSWLPNGLSFNTYYGRITGTPTTVTANGTYWLNYTVQGRTISSQITFGVSPTAPTLSYPSSPGLEKGSTMVPWTPTITGLSYLQSITITPALPLGLTIDQSNGTISGTPVNNMTSTQFSIVACNTWGACGAATTITLVIKEPLPSPVYGGNNTLTYARDVTVRECPVTSAGGMVATWSLSSGSGLASLPYGLAFNSTTGCFEGTPLLYSNAQTYAVAASNSGGSTIVYVSINITGAGIGLTYPAGSLILENGTTMQPIAGQTTGDNAQSWAISPSLPAGLNFGSTNGTIWGTPTASNNSTSYTVSVTSNSGFTASFSITIEILEPVEEIELTMPTGTVILVNGTPMQPLSGQTVGDAAVSWSISPSLPNGLQISATNGTIWGTPTETSSLVVYTVTAVTASGESDSDILSIMIQEDSDGDSIPDVVDTDDDNDGVLDGDEESGCEQNPDCDGDGTNDGDDAFPLDPSEDSDFDNDGIGDNADDDDDNDGWTETNETACGNHSDQDPLDYPTDTDGDGECDFTDTVDDREIAISYPVNVLDLTINQAMMTMSPTVTGGNVTSWSISPQLPNGLTFNETGVLSGTPSSNSSTISYVITASNGQYSTSTTLTITVYEVTGDADGDGIVDALDPDDDNDGWTDLDEANCNNTNSLNANDYPSDLDGDGLCDFNDNFRDLPLAMSYPSQTLELANGSEMTAYLPTVVGGDVATWEISGELPAGLSFGWSPARDASMDGSIRGTPTEEVPPTTYTIWANNSVSSASFDVTISVLKDTDTDGSPDIYDQDDDGDSWSDALEGLCGTDPLNVGDSPSDEDGDGICDALSTGPDMTDTDGDGVPDESDVFPNDPAAAFDNDNDGMPDDLFGFSTSNPRLIEDLDDDNDGWLDTREAECGSDRFDNLSLPIDSDEDGTCDGIDQDRDGDGFNNIVDDFPNDKSAFADLDNDGLPDDIDGSSNTGLVADTDDDGDNYTDQEEIECGSNPRDLNSVPLDSDGNGLCDAKESAGSIVDESNEEDGDAAFFISSRYWWCCILLLLLLLFLLIPLLGTNRKVVQLMKKGPEPPHTDSTPKFLEGKGTRKDPFVLASFSVPPGSTQVCSEKITITDISPSYLVGMVDRMEFENGPRFQMLDVKDNDDLDENKPVNEIEVEEDGTIVLRFLFTDEEEPTMAGASYDAILRVGSASVYFSWNVVVEGDPDYIAEQKAEEEARIAAAVKAKAEEEAADVEATKAKAEAEAAKVKAEAEVEAAKVKAEAEAAKVKAEAEVEAAKAKAEAEAEAAKAKAEAEAEIAKVKAEAEEAKAKAEAEAEEQRTSAKRAKAAADAEAAKLKAEAEEAKAKAEAEAAKAKAEAEEAKAKAEAEAEAAKAKAKADAEKAKAKADAEAEAQRAEAEKAKAAAEAEAEALRKQVEKEAAERQARMDRELEERRKRLENLDEKARKKEEELIRVAEKAKTIDFGTLGVAASSKLKKKVEKGTKDLEVADASRFDDKGEAFISDTDGGSRISWTGKAGNRLTGVKGIKRGFAAAAVLTVADDLQRIKGIGPFIEDKLNALGIYTFDQVGKMTPQLEETVNVAIEFFPGRVKRDEWAKQARKFAKR